MYYLEGTRSGFRLMAVTVQSSSTELRPEVPVPLFEFRGTNTTPQANVFLYSPTSDGQRFLVSASASDAEPTLNVITNWERAATAK